MNTYYHLLPSPIGRLLLTATGTGLSGIFMENHKGGPEPQPAWKEDFSALRDASSQLERYFQGTLRNFDLALDVQGTEFQRKVWDALRAIPYGATASYLGLAVAIGSAKAVRAVGAANGRNPISIVVPCHRVVGADGSLTGYGGGIWRKEFLLKHEAKMLGETRSSGAGV